MKKITTHESDQHFLLEVVPGEDKSPSHLKDWILANRAFLNEQITSRGGVLFKGFAVKTAQDFEDAILALDENLTDKHVFDGAVVTRRTKYVADVASPAIKKRLAPLSLHNEDSFVKELPEKIMFCTLESAPWGGETLIADCRKVYEAMPESIKKKYHHQDLVSTLVLEDKLFLANSLIPKNIEKIAQFAKKHGAESVERISYDMTRFTFQVPATVTLNHSNIWMNTLHQAVFYNNYVDIWKAYKMRGGMLNRLYAGGLMIRSMLKDFYHYLTKGRDPLKMHDCVLKSGEKITAWDRFQMGLAVWKHTVMLPLQNGDFFVADNRLVAHGRMPYKGRRLMVSAMTKPKRIEHGNPTV